MISLIQKSITVTGLSMGNRVITLFNEPTQEEISSNKYFNISKLCGKTARLSFLYNNNGPIQHSFCKVAVPYELSESDVRDLIILKIQESLAD
jgi:hypothetical protein